MDVTGPWICDTCGESIEKPENGRVEWLTKYDGNHPAGRDLRIVHHVTRSPLGGSKGCYPDEHAENVKDGSVVTSFPLDDALGPDGLVRLLTILEDSELPAPVVNRVIMRLFIPGYEQARPYFKRAVAEGVVEPNLPDGYFFQHQLRAIIDGIARPQNREQA